LIFQDVYRGRRVFVTGHTGFKGAWLSEWLLQLGADVGGLALLPQTNPSLFDLLKHERRISSHHISDVRCYEPIAELLGEFKPEIVFHLAAQPLVRRSYDHPKETFDTNVGGTVNILEAIRHTPTVKAAVIVTTDKVYQNRENLLGYRESDPLGGDDPYSASKAASEVVAHSYIRSFFARKPTTANIATARAGNVFGGGDWSPDRIVADCARAWLERRSVVIRNPDAIRPWQHVLDCLSGYLWLGVNLWTAREEATGEAFNFGPPASANQCVLSLVKEFTKTWPHASWQFAADCSTTKRETNRLLLNTDKAERQLNWMSTLDFVSSVAITSQWYRSYLSHDPIQLTQVQIEDYQGRAKNQNRLWAR